MEIDSTRLCRMLPSSVRKEEAVMADSDSFKNPTKKIRLFGVDISFDDVKNTTRKSRNPNLIIEEVPALAPAAGPGLLPLRFHPKILRGLTIQQHPSYLFEKKLASTDVDPCQNRLLIPKGEVGRLMENLTQEEREKVRNNAVMVVTTDNTHGVRYSLNLKRWPKTRATVLIHQWRQLVAANGLKMGDSVQGWGYRLNGEFRLALVIINN